jgi:hypothetical protein
MKNIIMSNKILYKVLPKSLLAIILVSSIWSCRKEQVNLLVGEWKMVAGPVVVMENQDYFFTFTEDKVYTGFTPINEPEKRDTCGIGKYYLRNAILTVDAIADECRGLTYHEDFTIKELTKDILIIYQFDGGYRLYEFVKVQKK